MSPRLRVLVHCLLALAAYVAVAPATAWAFSLVGESCTTGRLLVDCDFRSRDLDPTAYAALAVVTIGAMLASRLFAANSSWHPMAMLFGGLGVASLAYDWIMRRPIIGMDKIVDDTFNTLRFAVMASFLLVFGISRRVRLSPVGVVAAVVASNAAAVVAALVFVMVSHHVIGTTALYMLFLLYAFGGFGAHIMASSWLFASGTMAPEPEAAR